MATFNIRWVVSGVVVLALVMGFQNCANSNFVGRGNSEADVLKQGTADMFSTLEDTPLDGQVRSIGKLEEKSASFQALSQPANGKLESMDSSTGKFRYMPGKDFFGSDSFTFSETVAGAEPVVRTAQIKVDPANDRPWIVSDSFSFDMNSSGNSITIEARDIEDTALSILISKDGSREVNTPNGRLTSDGSGTLRYTPNPNFRGTDTIELMVKDSGGDTNTKQISVIIGNPFREIQPAMAVRGMACISCHAKINSTVITDFGFGDDFFFGKKALALPNSSVFQGWSASSGHTGVYSDHGLVSLGTAQFTASIFLPNAPIGFDLKRQSYTLKDTSKPDEETNRNYVSDAVKPGISPQLDAVTLRDYVFALEEQKRVAQKPYSPSVQVKNQIFIGAPDAATIKDKLAIGTQPWAFYKNSGDSPGLSGVTRASAGGINYTLATGTVTCDGDLGVDGILFLKDVTIETISGCRVYATGAIFQQGEIKYTKSPASSSSKNLMNLQLVSADSITMGVGMSDCESVDNPGWYHTHRANGYKPLVLRHGTHSPETRRLKGGTTAASDRLTLLSSFATAVDLQDASCRGGTNPRAVHFERLLLVAPNVQSRYTGNFKGVIIAEFANFALSKFTFSFDEIFNQVPVLPVIETSSYLIVK